MRFSSSIWAHGHFAKDPFSTGGYGKRDGFGDEARLHALLKLGAVIFPQFIVLGLVDEGGVNCTRIDRCDGELISEFNAQGFADGQHRMLGRAIDATVRKHVSSRDRANLDYVSFVFN